MSEHLHPISDRLLTRADRQRLTRQTSRTIWLVGLSGSGKSTLAAALEKRLYADGHAVYVLDGDNVRGGLNRGLGFSDADREENIRRIAEVSKLFVDAGVVAINSFITPRESLRALARRIIGEGDLLEIYVKASLETCRRRDVKGLYAKADQGLVPQFTGKDSAFEEPAAAGLTIDTEAQSVEESLEALYRFAKPRLEL